ncbi:MAG: TonB-dependent receptor [Phocaeicola sp.]|nr:TonB-dependent receptor [Phocaeicola sp.]
MRKMMLFMAMLFVGIGLVNAQVSQVTGTVVSAEDGLPVVGASVLVKGTTVGTVTDIDGNFTISGVPEDGKIIVVSFIGLKSQELPIEPVMNVTLQSDAKVLEEVMVVAYGVAKKESFTGSAEVIKSEKIQARPVANVTKALDGLVSGVQTTSGSGQPGSGVSVVVRGYGSINSSQNPLYVVDGVPYDGNVVSINPNDIESMTVLKDASAGALYGSRGANGVVMITTKRGNSGKVKVNLKANWGVASRAIPRYETMDEAGYIETVYQSYKNNLVINNGMSPQTASVVALQNMKTGPTAIFGANEQYNPFNYSITELIDPATGKVRSDAVLKYSEDWMDEAMRNNPLRQEYNVSFTGGNEKTKYMFSVGYLDEKGLLKTTGFTRYNGRMNIESEVTDWFKAGMNASYSRNESNTAVENSSGSSNVWYTAQLMAPIFPVYEKDAEGKDIIDVNGNKVFDYGTNRPAGASADWHTIATLYDDKYANNSDNLSGRLFAEIGNLKEGVLEGLKLSVNYGFDLVSADNMTYYNPYNGNSVSVKGSLQKSASRTFSFTFNQLLSYDRTFNKHHINALVGHEFYKYNYQYLGASKTGFPFGGLYELDAATNITGASSYQHNYAVESVLSRFAYDFDDRYYLSASFRTDGSSRFHKDNRWGQFWSVGANWRISREKFMKDVSWVDNLSMKVSYGVQGNDNIGTYYAWQSLYNFGSSNADYPGLSASSLGNPDLKWEKNANLNAGVEGRFMNRFNVAVEWYSRKTTDMLMLFPMASSLGFDGYNKNIGSMRNTGWDITLGADIFQGDSFNWRFTVMGSTVKNKVLQLADKPEIISGNYIIKEGETLNSFYTVTSAGVDPATGKQLYWVWDTDKNGVRGEKYISDSQSKATACKEIQGSRIPDIYGSFSNEFSYKNFDLSVLCTYSVGGKVLDGVYNTLMYGNYIGQAKSAHLERAWKQPGDITDVPRIEIGKSYIITDNNLINASYLAIKNITLGYTLPAKVLKSLGLESLRLTATGDNLVLFNHLKGMDPQYNFTGGTNFGYVPVRTISFGIDVTF